MPEPRPELPPFPDRIKLLPLDERGYPIPWFVGTGEDGKRDFRFVNPGTAEYAHRNELCWVCGQPRGRYLAFVIGPMCVINRVSAEPPSHHECALFSVKACPFLTKPHMVRRENDIPEGVNDGPGMMIRRNPGSSCIWTTKRYHTDRGIFRIGDPITVEWFAEGRKASRDEVMRSVATGLPILQDAAEKDGPDAVEELNKMFAAAQAFFPKE